MARGRREGVVGIGGGNGRDWGGTENNGHFFSVMSMSPLYGGAHSWTPHSRCAEEEGRITSHLQAILGLVHPKTPFAISAARTRCWLLFNSVSTGTPRAFLQRCFPAGQPQCVLVPGDGPLSGSSHSGSFQSTALLIQPILQLVFEELTRGAMSKALHKPRKTTSIAPPSSIGLVLAL